MRKIICVFCYSLTNWLLLYKRYICPSERFPAAWFNLLTFAVRMALCSSGQLNQVRGLQQLYPGLDFIELSNLFLFVFKLLEKMVLFLSCYFISAANSYHLSFLSLMDLQEHLAPSGYLKIPTVSIILQFRLKDFLCCIV